MGNARQPTRTLIPAVLLLGLAASAARAEPPPIVPVQGYLTDAAGAALDGSHSLRLELFRVAVGGTAVYRETHSDVTVEDGAFVVYLGGTAGQALDLSLFVDNPELWLQVTVDDTEVIEPRFRLGTVPYAASAAFCGDADALGGRDAADYVTVDDAVAWSDVTGIPASIADGDSDVLAGLSCSAGSAVLRTASGWECRALDAADLKTGVLNTTRYSAYDDLMNEMYIDSAAANTLQTRSASDARYLRIGQTVTTHTATAGASPDSVQATNKTFCGLSSVEWTTDSTSPMNPLTRGCDIQHSGTTFTLTATGDMNWDVTCVMFCF